MQRKSVKSKKDGEQRRDPNHQMVPTGVSGVNIQFPLIWNSVLTIWIDVKLGVPILRIMSNRAAIEVETPSVMVVEQIQDIRTLKNISSMMDKVINILALESENKDTENQEKRNNYEDADTLNQRIRIF